MSKQAALSSDTSARAPRRNALRDMGLAALGAGAGVLAAGVAWPLSLLAAAGSALAVAVIERDRLADPSGPERL